LFGVTARLPDACPPAAEAVMEAPFDAPALVCTLNVTLLCPAGTTTLDGRFVKADGLLVLMFTVSFAVGEPARFTVTDSESPAVTELGVGTTEMGPYSPAMVFCTYF
jgi:hypothetical protein